MHISELCLALAIVTPAVSISALPVISTDWARPSPVVQAFVAAPVTTITSILPSTALCFSHLDSYIFPL